MSAVYRVTKEELEKAFKKNALSIPETKCVIATLTKYNAFSEYIENVAEYYKNYAYGSRTAYKKHINKLTRDIGMGFCGHNCKARTSNFWHTLHLETVENIEKFNAKESIWGMLRRRENNEIH